MFFTSGLAVTPWATTLSRTVQPAATMIVSLPGSLSWMTRTAKTMVERGEPMNDATEWIDPSETVLHGSAGGRSDPGSSWSHTMRT